MRARRRPVSIVAGIVGALAVAGVARADPPPSPAPAPPKPRDDTPADAKKKGEPSADEIKVKGHRRDVGGVSMRRDEAKEIPGTFGDPARFVETMPGVVPTTSGLQQFYVRGAPPETTGYFVDGVPVPTLYHVGFGPSVVHAGLLDRVELFSGAAPSYFGRAIGATIASDTTAPATHTHGEGNVRILDTSALLESPFAEGRGSAEVSGRYAYPGLIVPLFAPGVGLSYWDYQARVTWKLADRDRIGAFVFGSSDDLTQTQNNAANIPYTAQLSLTEFHRADLRYDHSFDGGTSLRIAATLGHDRSGNEVSDIDSTSVRLRSELEARPSPTVRVRAGADTQWTHYENGPSPLQPADPTQPASTPPISARDDGVVGAYVDVSWRISRHVELVPGVRADLFTSRYAATGALALSPTTTPAVDPRLAARVTVAPRVTAISTIGVAHEVPGLIIFAPDATPFLTPPGIERGIQSAEQISEGLEVALPEGFVASATGFLHHYTALPDLTAPCIPSANGESCFAQQVDGRAYGLELLVRRALTERFAILVSYTLSRSERQSHSYDPSQPVVWIPSEYDRTHVGSVVASYDLGRRWRVGVRFFGYTGRPYSRSYEEMPVPPFNTERLPGFWRLDLRLEKSWEIGRSGRLSFIVEGLNVTLNKEVVDENCQPTGPALPPTRSGGPPVGASYDTCTQDALGPITIPSVGVEGAF